MNLKQKITLALATLMVGGAGYAQQSGEVVSPGSLGHRYVDFDFGLQDVKGTSDNAYNLGVGVNLPVNSNLDASFGYDYSWFNTHVLATKVDSDADAFTAGVTAYTTTNGLKPFIGGGLGYQWISAKSGAIKTDDDFGIWAVAVGVEIPVGPVAITPAITYADAFKKSIDGQYNYGVEANYWVTKTVGVYGDLSYTDVQHSSQDGWTYTVGLRVKF